MAYDKPIAVLTIAAEASSQSHAGRQGVAASLFNRLAAKRYGSTIAGICLKRFQYSEWNGDAADNANLERVANMSPDDPVILDCAIAYDEAAAGADPTNGATHFWADTIPEPYWAKQATLTVKIGAIQFAKDVP
jgi:N-acetylmuramoyl-L-alanine amidase